MELDLKNRKILFELEKNARQSNSSIAKSVGLSKDAVNYRIKQLENKGLIRGYRTLIDISKIGYVFYRVYLKLIDVSKTDLNKIISFLKEEKNVWWIGRLDGSWDFMFTYWSTSNKEFYDFYERFSKQFRKHIKEKLVSPMIDYKEIPRRYLLHSKTIPDLKIQDKKVIKIDEKDITILRMLSKNARTPLITIASQLHMDSMAIHHRIKNLEEKKVIRGYKEDLDINKLERDFYTVEIDLNDFSKLEEIKTAIFSLKEVSAIPTSIAGYDIECDLDIKNSQEYYKIIDELKNNYPEIREIRYFRIIENYKILYFPEE